MLRSPSDAQRAEVLHAAAEHLGQVAVRGPHLRTALPPLAQPLGRLRPVHRLSARMPQLHGHAVVDRDRLDGHSPLGVPRHGHPPGQLAVVADRRIVVAGDLQFLPSLPAAAGDDQARLGDRGARRRSRLGPALDLEQVGEVGLGDQRHGESLRLGRGIAQGDVLAHAVADVSAAHRHTAWCCRPGRPAAASGRETWRRTARLAAPTAAAARCRLPAAPTATASGCRARIARATGRAGCRHSAR